MGIHDCAVAVLSAGKGSRVGISKGLFRYQGKAWIEWQLEWLRELGLKQIVVVLGHEKQKYPPLAQVTLVENPSPERGPFSSLVSALAVIDAPVFVLPVDVPCPSKPTWEAVAASLVGNTRAAVPSFGGHGGHPVLLSKDLVHLLRALPPDSARLDHELKKLNAEEFQLVSVADSRVVRDLNSPDDWDAL